MFLTNNNITNAAFLSAIFGEDALWCHVTDFSYDPNDIPKDRHLYAWAGNYFNHYQFGENTNQYFTISLFYCDDEKKARRRKALFRKTPCIVLDDVKEKLSMEEVQKLPQPSWVLETSPGSEQWGYILETPCEDRGRVENLLDGLVANGLAPQGKDPGMKGVTRYVRLPEGINNKASKLVNGQPFKCQLLVWEPQRKTTMEALAQPFSVNLDAVRREARVDGAAEVTDHPLVNIPEIIHIKEVRSDGRFDITCPWVDEHTGADDSGSAVFTNTDNSFGFKCHHGACQERTGADLLRFINGEKPGFSAELKNWQVKKSFSDLAISAPEPLTPTAQTQTPSFTEEPTPAEDCALTQALASLKKIHPNTPEHRAYSAEVLRLVDDMPKVEQKYWHSEIAHDMGWNKSELKEILTDLRKQWYKEKVSTANFYDNVVYVKDINQFYDWSSSIFYTTEGFQNSYGHEDAEAKKIALVEGRVEKVDSLDYAPKKPRIFEEDGKRYGNTWDDSNMPKGVKGPVDRWRDHFDVLGWGDNRDHVEKWMAYTLRHPETKINHMLLFGGGEGCGKDFLIYPLIMGMADHHEVISGEELLEGFNDYLLSTKYLHINEVELGDRNDAQAVGNKLKPIATAPPERVRVNQKGIKKIRVRNIINGTISTNSMLPMRLKSGVSRRYYALWSDLKIRDSRDNMIPAWRDYWCDRWDWMRADNGFSNFVPGWQCVLDYLLNEVDLTGFNPGEAPPMTEFLREIKDESMSPAMQTLTTFIEKAHGAFACDVLTSKEMGQVLRAGALYPGDMMSDPRYFTDRKISSLLREAGFSQIRTANYRMWVLRNELKYLNLEPSVVERFYLDSLAYMKSLATLRSVED